MKQRRLKLKLSKVCTATGPVVHLCRSYIEHYHIIVVTVPDGLKSTSDSLKLVIQIKNSLSETIQYHWVNYEGSAVYVGEVYPGSVIGQTSYGTHPWLITTTSGEVIAYFVPELSDLDVTVQ